MAILSPDREAIAHLVAETYDGSRDQRFDPTSIAALSQAALSTGDATPTPLFLKGTAAFIGIKGPGCFSVAIFSDEPEGISRHTTDDIIHGACDYAVLHRRPKEEEAALARKVGEPRGLGEATAWAFEMLQQAPDAVDTLVSTGASTVYQPIR